MDRWPQRERFRELVRRHRVRRKLSHEELAEALGIAPSTLNNFLYSRQLMPGRESIRRAASLFGVSISELMDDPGAPPPGVPPKAYLRATEQDRAALARILRDLESLTPAQKALAMEHWALGLKLIKNGGR